MNKDSFAIYRLTTDQYLVYQNDILKMLCRIDFESEDCVKRCLIDSHESSM